MWYKSGQKDETHPDASDGIRPLSTLPVRPLQVKHDERTYSLFGTPGRIVGNILLLGRSLHAWLFVGRCGEASLCHREAAVLPRHEAEAQGWIRRRGGGRGSWN